MLVLNRKQDEKIKIGDDIEIVVVSIAPSVVALGITAPKEMRVARVAAEPSWEAFLAEKRVPLPPPVIKRPAQEQPARVAPKDIFYSTPPRPGQRSREERAAATRERMLAEIRRDLRQICGNTFAQQMPQLNSGQMALIRREVARVRDLISDCCATVPAPEKPAAPLLRKVKNRGKENKGAREEREHNDGPAE
jgi:carbon storage regulator CsrA